MNKRERERSKRGEADHVKKDKLHNRYIIASLTDSYLNKKKENTQNRSI